MGAVLSIPIASASAFAGAACASFCSSATAAVLCRPCNLSSPVATRVAFAVLFWFMALVAWVVSVSPIADVIESWLPAYLQINCQSGQECFRVLAVHRIMLAVCIFHIAVGIITNRTSGSQSAIIQHGWWGAKTMILFFLTASAFFIPTRVVSKMSALSLFLSFLFMVRGSILLVDFVHTFAETCIDRWERDQSEIWKFLLVGSTLALYAFATVSLAVLFYLTPEGCTWNAACLAITSVFCVAITVLSVLPAVQDANPRSGLAQSSILIAYGVYLVGSSLLTRSDEKCRPMGSQGSNFWLKSLGTVFTFAAIAYSATHASISTNGPDGYKPLVQDLVTEQPTFRDQLRVDAVRSDTGDSNLQPNVEELEEAPDAAESSMYSYNQMHETLAAAACFVAMLLTNWCVSTDQVHTLL